MAPNVLPQMLFMVLAQSAPKNLAFAALVSRIPSVGALVSGVSTGCCSLALSERARRCYFVARAEENTGGMVKDKETSENVDKEEFLETDDTEVLSDEKPPFPPRTKSPRKFQRIGKDFIVISKQNAGIHSTIRVRRVIAGVGVEIVFLIYSPNIKVLKVVNHRKVRRARLYYLRDKLPKLSTFK